MRFSIVIPAHNEELTIAGALASISAQDFDDFEVVVVCDRCTDSTVQVCQAFGIDSLSVEAGSAGGARNIGIEQSSGDYLLFLDADDFLLGSDALSKVHAGLIANFEPDVLHFSFIWGRCVVPPISWHSRFYGMSCSRAWRRDFVGLTRFPSSSFGEDWRFCYDVFSRPGSHAVLDDPIFQYVYPRKESATGRWLNYPPMVRSAILEREDSEWMGSRG